MRLRPPTLVWPCVDVQTGLAYPLMPSEPEAGARRTLRDVLVLRPGTTVMDLFEILLVRRMPRAMHTSSALLRGADGAEWPPALCDALGLPVRTRVRVCACARAYVRVLGSMARGSWWAGTTSEQRGAAFMAAQRNS
eukprot:COSAG01_NODE_439_length_17034_cov_5.326484_8_plen_137_part_00